MNQIPPPLPPSPPTIPPAPYEPPQSGNGIDPPVIPGSSSGKGSIILGVVLGFGIPIAGLFAGGVLAGVSNALDRSNEIAFLLLLFGVPIGGLIAAFTAFWRSGKTRTVGGMLIGLGIIAMLVVACFSMLAGTNFH